MIACVSDNNFLESDAEFACRELGDAAISDSENDQCTNDKPESVSA